MKVVIITVPMKTHHEISKVQYPIDGKSSNIYIEFHRK